MKTSFPIHASLMLALAFGMATPALAQSERPVGRVNPQRLGSYWILVNQNVDIDVPNSARINKPGCAAISYVIGSDGIPRQLKVEKSVPGNDYGKVAMSAVANFRYGPSLSNRDSQPVKTYYVVPFNAPDDSQGQQQVMAPCHLMGYGED